MKHRRYYTHSVISILLRTLIAQLTVPVSIQFDSLSQLNRHSPNPLFTIAKRQRSCKFYAIKLFKLHEMQSPFILLYSPRVHFCFKSSIFIGFLHRGPDAVRFGRSIDLPVVGGSIYREWFLEKEGGKERALARREEIIAMGKMHALSSSAHHIPSTIERASSVKKRPDTSWLVFLAGQFFSDA